MSDKAELPNLFNFNKQKLDAHPDTIDFRDMMYVPTLVEVPTQIPLMDYRAFQVPILDQGQEGACTGFGLATVANYLLRRRRVFPDKTQVSPRMFYEMARRYDEWPGEKYSGSSARGAMKGWHKHGICSEDKWSYSPNNAGSLTSERAVDAIDRPLGAYFRVNHKNLVALHSAIAEVGILFATGNVHEGWGKIDGNGIIPYTPNSQVRGGHAFAIVAFESSGLWIQNSWGPDWGFGGFARISYDDWLANGTDVWVARLSAPVTLMTNQGAASVASPGSNQASGISYNDLRPHIISMENEGYLKNSGTYANTETDIEEMFLQDIPSITADWDKKRIFLYAHGGLVGESVFVQRVAEYRSALLKSQVYPIALVWNSDFWSTVTNIIKDAVAQRRPEGLLTSAMDFMLDRLDDTIEPIARIVGGEAQWNEMKENARLSTINGEGGARIVLKYLAELMMKDPTVEVHLAGHSAGSIFLAPFVQLLTTLGKVRSGYLKGAAGYGLKVKTCALWAPGISVSEFKDTYLPAIKKGSIADFTLFTLTDQAEQDDNCANIYHKSLLYMVANALETQRYTPILGMEKYVNADADLTALFRGRKATWIKAPNEELAGSLNASHSRHHGDFDDDIATLQATLGRILSSEEAKPEFKFNRSSASLRNKRLALRI